MRTLHHFELWGIVYCVIVIGIFVSFRMAEYQLKLVSILNKENKLPTPTNFIFQAARSNTITKNSVGYGHKDNLTREFVELNRTKLLIGIPTVRRQNKDYLLDTLNDLLGKMYFKPTTNNHVKFLIFISEPFDKEAEQSIQNNIRSNFSEHLKTGLFTIYSVPYQAEEYIRATDLTNVRKTFGDNNARLIWRFKQNIDFANLFQMAFNMNAEYYLQLEDDIKASLHFDKKIIDFIENLKLKNWFYINFSALGFIGKVFQRRDLYGTASFFRSFYWAQPVDWLLMILELTYCNSLHDANLHHCKSNQGPVKVAYPWKSLFQHMGTQSSLPGKLNPLQDRYFVEQ